MTALVPANSNPFNIEENLTVVNRIGPFGDTSLYIVNYLPSNNETIQIFLSNNALQSLKGLSYRSQSTDQFQIVEIQCLFSKQLNLFHSNENLDENNYVEWSLFGSNLIKKRQEFRQQIDLYKTYDNQNHFITKILMEIIEYYLNEYLLQHEHFSLEEIRKLEFYFKRAIEQNNYFEYFIKAYTLTNNFHYILNKHLALYILDYFDTNKYSSTKYRLINCLVHIITLVINDPDIHKYQYQGITYRGLLMNKNDLKFYQIGNHILNRSFVSTSKNRLIAQMFTNTNPENSDETKISVLFKYHTKQEQTAIDVENLSTIADEQEVLILPFSVFQIKNRIENDVRMNSSVLLEIDLEECDDEEPTIISRKLCKFISIGIFSILGLILAVSLIVIFNRPRPSISSGNQNLFESLCPPILSRLVWNATEPRDFNLLTTPVRYVVIHQVSHHQCHDLSSCIKIVKSWQTLHMETKGWADIAYNFIVGTNGDVFEGRGWKHVGAHCVNYNQRSIGIAIIGNWTIHPVPNKAVTTVRSLIECGISFDYIEKNYTVVEHWSSNIYESLLLGLNRVSSDVIKCSSTG